MRLKITGDDTAHLAIVAAKQYEKCHHPAAVWVETELDPAWVAAFRILPAPDGSPVIAEVRVFPQHAGRDPGTWAADQRPFDLRPVPAARELVPAGGLTARALRRVRVPGAVLFTRRLMREFVKGWGAEGVDAGAVLFAPAGLRPDAPEQRSGPGRKPLPDEILAHAAAAYVAAMERGETPVPAVARELQVARDTAADYVYKARRRGLLTAPTRPGRAGGALTARAEKLLRADRRKGKR